MTIITRTTLNFVTSCSALACFGCSDAPFVVEAKQNMSPDSKWVATLEEVDNGLGFGLGALFEEIHLTRPGQKVTGHGDSEKTAIFYIESNDKELSTRIKWLDNNHLLVKFDSSKIPGKKTSAYSGIFMEYEPYPKKPNARP